VFAGGPEKKGRKFIGFGWDDEGPRKARAVGGRRRLGAQEANPDAEGYAQANQPPPMGTKNANGASGNRSRALQEAVHFTGIAQPMALKQELRAKFKHLLAITGLVKNSFWVLK